MVMFVCIFHFSLKHDYMMDIKLDEARCQSVDTKIPILGQMCFCDKIRKSGELVKVGQKKP